MVLVGLAAMLGISTAYAKDCEIRPSNLDAFGRYRLGHLRAIPKDAKRLPRCTVYRKYHTFDCEFVDADGTHYTTADDEIAKIVRRPDDSAALPPNYPLKFGMPLEEAHRILSAMDPKIDFAAGCAKSGCDIGTGECLKDSRGVTCWFSAYFDKGRRLNRLEAGFVTAED
jgi:hypothetical protein